MTTEWTTSRCSAIDPQGRSCVLPSEHEGPHTAEAPKPSSSGSLPAVAVIAAGIGYAVAAFLPWISLSAPLVGTLTRNGIDGGGDGIVVMGLGLALALVGARMLARPGTMGVATALLGFAGVGMFAVEYPAILERIESIDSNNSLASVGIGLYVLLVAAVGAVITGISVSRSNGAPVDRERWGTPSPG